MEISLVVFTYIYMEKFFFHLNSPSQKFSIKKLTLKGVELSYYCYDEAFIYLTRSEIYSLFVNRVSLWKFIHVSSTLGTFQAFLSRKIIYDGVETLTRKSQARFQIIYVLCLASLA